MSLFPIAMTQVNWDRLSNLWEGELGEHPVRILDNEGSATSDPSAFYKVTKNLDGIAMKHVSMSFAYTGSEDISWLGCHSIAISGKESFHLLTADLFTWYTIINELSPLVVKKHRVILNVIFIHLRDLGFNLWKNHNKIELKDGTFYMRGT